MSRIFLLAMASCVAWGQEAPADWLNLPVFRGSWRGRPVQFRAVNGFAVIEGDIILGPVAEVAQPPEGPGKGRELPQSSVIFAETTRWPDATVPFVLDPDVPKPERVTAAIQHWHDKTFVRFVERTTQANYVRIRKAPSGCNSSVGMRGGQQFINLGDACDMAATVHELGHAVGLWHEQSRIDRDRYVRVEYQNIDKRYWHDFDQNIADGDDLGPYDYYSIMHYPIFGFPRNNLPSMTTLPPGIPIGQRTALSPGDIQGVYRAYKRPLEQTTITSTPPGAQLIVDGEPVTTPRQYTWAAGETHTVSAPETVPTASGTARYSFARWSDEGEREHVIQVGTERVYSAQFSLQYLFRTGTSPSAGGTVTVSPESADGYYPVGAVVRVSAQPAQDFSFVQWSPGAGGATVQGLNGLGLSANPSIFPVDRGTLIYTAVFTQGPTTLVSSQPEGRTVTVDGIDMLTPRVFTYAPGSTHTLSAAPSQLGPGGSERYKFKGWSNGETGDLTLSAGAGDSTITAMFQTQYLLTLNWDYIVAGGAELPRLTNINAIGASADNFYDAGSTVQLGATDGTGFVFSNWYGDATGAANPFSLTVNEQMSVIGNFLSPPRINLGSILNDASLQPGPISANQALTIYCPQIGPEAEQSGTPDAQGQLPTRLANTRVLIGGEPAGLLSVGRNRVRVVTPAAVSGKKTVPVAVESNGVSGTARTVSVLPATPALYTASGGGTGPALVFDENGTQLPADTPMSRGAIIRLRATGVGGLPVTLYVDGVEADGIEVKPLSGFPGVVQIAARIPNGAPAGAAPIMVTAGGISTPYGVTIAVAP